MGKTKITFTLLVIMCTFLYSCKYKEYKNKLYNYKQPILIYAEWNFNHAEVTCGKQIVPLKTN